MGDNKREYARQIRSAVKSAVIQAQDNLANVHIPTSGQRGAVIGIVNRICGGDDNRKLLLGWLFASEDEAFDKLSTKTLNDAQWAALYAWCDFQKDEERIIWIPKNTFAQECLAVLSAAMDDYFNVPYMERDELPEPPEIIASIINYTGGEIITAGVRNAGVQVASDALFAHDKQVAEAPRTPPDPYAHVQPRGRLDISKILEESEEQAQEHIPEPTPPPPQPKLKPVMKQKPKLHNPFD